MCASEHPADTDSAIPEVFEAGELAVVLSRYDLGVIESVRAFPRGSRRSPKLLIRSERGVFLLKRRAKGRDDPRRVALAHQVQNALAASGFPVAQLIGQRGSGATLTELEGSIYELFRFAAGEPYAQQLPQTREAGRMLAVFHREVGAMALRLESAGHQGYHLSPHVAAQLGLVPDRISAAEGRAEGAAVRGVVMELARAYAEAGERVRRLGADEWPAQITHGDWHPGNMLFKGSTIAAVLDFDTVRQEPRALDVANGALQFSMTKDGDDPASWPDFPDESRLRIFCEGYDSVEGSTISLCEVQALPWLMIEALIAETAGPIAATGRFGTLAGTKVLRMVDRKVRWLEQHAEHLAGELG